MSQFCNRDGAHPETQSRRQIDNSQLYENIGNIIIERAHAGDKDVRTSMCAHGKKRRTP
jgi:hypothetical protein